MTETRATNLILHTPGLPERILGLRAQGLSIRKISDIVGVGKSIIGRYLKSHAATISRN